MNKKLVGLVAAAVLFVGGMWMEASTTINGDRTVSGALTVTGHTTFEAVTSTGATGTGNIVYSGSPTLVTPALGIPSALNCTNCTAVPLAALPASVVSVATQSVNLAGAGRAFSTVYQNTGTRPIFVSTSANTTGGSGANPGLTSFRTDASNPPTTIVQYGAYSNTAAASTFAIVMPGNFYRLVDGATSGTGSLLLWFEWQ